MSDGPKDVVVVFRAVGWSARPVRGSGGGAYCGVVYDRVVGDACGWWRARSAVLFPSSPDPGGVVVMLVVRVVWAPEWMIVSVAALLARVVWASAQMRLVLGYG